ncbi:GNAT family N-acetyltransferase [Halocatena marina]|uniref:GNAT family N-acetyltransferase n=1 Tax=Halocatena marina TaxID=2934937 RepID=A0ABD5YYH7_9EURY
MPGPIFIRGERITLRTVESDDLDFENKHRNDPRIRKPLTFSMPLNHDQAESRFERHTESDESVSLWICADEDPVGKVDLFDINQTHGTSEIAYWLVPEFWGNGYASDAVDLLVRYAFEERRLRKVSAHVLVENEGSQAVLERAGFQREGRLRDERYVDGEHCDVFRYGLLAT